MYSIPYVFFLSQMVDNPNEKGWMSEVPKEEYQECLLTEDREHNWTYTKRFCVWADLCFLFFCQHYQLLVSPLKFSPLENSYDFLYTQASTYQGVNTGKYSSWKLQKKICLN